MRGARNEMGNGAGALLFNAAFVGFTMLPIVVVILVSFTTKPYLALPWDGVSLQWYVALLHNRDFIGSLWVSLRLAFVAASAAVLMSLPAAFAIARHAFPGRAVLSAFLLSPLMIPAVVLGIAFLRFLTLAGLGGTFLSLALCHVVLVTPFVLRLLLAALAGMDRQVERAAVSLGAGPVTLLRRVTLPLLLPGIAGGWVLAFITSLDDLTVTIFVAPPALTTLPVRVFNYIDQMTDPLVAAVSTALIVVTGGLMLLLDRLYGLDRLLVGR